MEVTMNKQAIINTRRMLQFILKCEQCGTCCISSTQIELTKDDAARIAKYLGVPETEFSMRYPGKPSKRAMKQSKPCPFYKDGCTIYEVRPTACKDYPFMNGSFDSTKVVIHNKCPAALEAYRKAGELKTHVNSCDTCRAYGPRACKVAKEILGI
jgi:hypothetical protein